MTNRDPETGVRCGVISVNSLDPDIVHELFYGSGAVDISYQEAYAEAKVEAGRMFDNLLEEANIAAGETDAHMSAHALERFIESWFDNHRPSDPYLGTPYDRDEYIEQYLHMFSDCCQIDEPTIQGTYQGVKYQLSTLGGAYLLWALKGPEAWANRLCSPCVPDAADLDGGFTLTSEQRQEEEGDFLCYAFPRDWLFVEATV